MFSAVPLKIKMDARECAACLSYIVLPLAESCGECLLGYRKLP
jgi:hypothetical protein